MTGLYPLKFEPGLKERVWGGNFLQTEFRKKADPEKTGPPLSTHSTSWQAYCQTHMSD